MTKQLIRVGGYAPRESVHSRALDCFADFVRDESNGDIEVEILYNIMDLDRPAVDLLEMMITGELTMCYFSTSYLGSSVPLVNALEIPFLFDSLDVAHQALDGRFGAALSEAIQNAYACEVLGYWDNGFRHLTNAVRPLRSPADCEGLTIRLQPNQVHEALATSWGMTPVPSELSIGIKLIASGEVDAQENPLANASAYGVTHPHITLTSHLYGARGVFASSKQLTTLGTLAADLTRRGARVAIDYQRSEAKLYEITVRDRFEAEGRTVVDLSDEQRQAFVDASRSVISDARAAVPADVLALLP
jgi:TRAP-type C4-dicarboxylate transport system substrate-binding protein